MTRVDQAQRAVVIEPAESRCCKSIARQERREELVQPRRGPRRITFCRCARGDAMLELLLNHGHHDRGGQTLAGHVTDSEPQALLVAVGEVEVAGEGPRWTRHRVDVSYAVFANGWHRRHGRNPFFSASVSV